MQTTAESYPRRRSAWLVSEDWWAVWVGLALYAGATAGWIGPVPKPAAWHTPAEALGALDWASLIPTLSWLALTSAIALYAMGMRPLAYLPPASW